MSVFISVVRISVPFILKVFDRCIIISLKWAVFLSKLKTQNLRRWHCALQQENVTVFMVSFG